MSYHDNGRWYIKGWPDKRIDKYGGDAPKVTFRIDFEADDKTRGRSVASFAGHLTVEQARFVAQEIADAIVEAETGKRPVHPTRIITLVGERGGVP
jgi:hypothetical protein